MSNTFNKKRRLSSEAEPNVFSEDGGAPASRIRIGFVFPMFAVSVVVLVGRLFMIQILQHDKLLARAERQSVSRIEIPPTRGGIFDSSGQMLALSLEMPAVFVDPGVVAVPAKAREWLPQVLQVSPEDFKRFLQKRSDMTAKISDPTLERVIEVTKELAKETGVGEQTYMVRLDAAIEQRLVEISRTLAPLLDLPEQQIYLELKKPTRFEVLKKITDEECANKIRALDICGIGIQPRQQRRLPQILRTGQWQGFVGGEGKGVDGLELAFEERLRGSAGFTTAERDGRGRVIAHSADPDIPAKHGQDIYLTIDSRLQQIVNEEMTRLYVEFTPVSASVIIMDPYTGRILAMDSVPGLELSQLPTMTDPNELQRRLRNHPVQSQYEPGSTFKPFIIAAAIDARLVAPGTMINCQGGSAQFKNGRNSVRTVHDSHAGTGVVSVTDVCAFSSNVGAAKIGVMLGGAKMQTFLRSCGFGAKTGIELPGEADGQMTSPANWKPDSTISVSFGQEIAVSPLQLITGFCALINGGHLMQPYIVQSVVDPNTGRSATRTPAEIHRVISDQTSSAMRGVLAAVVEHGTGKLLNKCKYTIGGKTGTAQKADPGGGFAGGRYISSFIGFAPVDQPKIAVLVMVDEPQRAYYGATVAAPVVGRIIEKSLTILDSTPNIIVATPPSDQVSRNSNRGQQ